LEALLTSDNVPSATVRFAVDMAKGCNVQELNPMLTNQALDETQAFGKRAYALDILREIATDEAKQALRPLIHRIPAEDEQDNFRGDLLWLLWPTHLEPDELLPLLTSEKDDHFIGSYHSFMYKLEKADVPFSPASVIASLHWLSQNWSAVEYRHRRTELWKRIALLIWRRAWQLIDEPGVKEALAKAYAKIVEHHDYFSTEGASDAARLQSKEAKKDRKEWLQGQKRKRKENWRKKNRRRVTLHKVGKQARFMHWVINQEVDRAC
nr:hypothetical protein [Tanacetum cinerariifolium]